MTPSPPAAAAAAAAATAKAQITILRKLLLQNYHYRFSCTSSAEPGVDVVTAENSVSESAALLMAEILQHPQFLNIV